MHLFKGNIFDDISVTSISICLYVQCFKSWILFLSDKSCALNIAVKISAEGNGNVEIVFVKHETGKTWSSLGKELPGHHKLLQKNDRGMIKMEL